MCLVMTCPCVSGVGADRDDAVGHFQLGEPLAHHAAEG